MSDTTAEGLTEGEREALWSAMRRIRHEDAPVSILREDVKTHALWAVTPAVVRILADRLAAVQAEWRAATGEPDAEHARLSVDDLAAMADAARAEGSIEGQMRHITVEMARGDQPLEAKEEFIADLRARLSHAEAERDAARAELEALADEWDDALNQEEMTKHHAADRLRAALDAER